MATDVATWLYRLDTNHTWTSPFLLDADYAFADSGGGVRLILERNGAITVTRGYAWNGCSPKLRVLDLLVGTPEGVVNARTGERKTYFASLVHDALYQFRADGLPLSRAQADQCFLLLMRESGFLLAPVYWFAVRVFGGLVHAATRRHREWRGSMRRFTPEVVAPPPVAVATPAFIAVPAGRVAGTPPVPGGSAAHAAAPVRIASVDHFVLYVADVDASIAFYARVLGMEAVTFAGGRRALGFGVQKINLHPSGREYIPHAATPARGAGDFCLLTEVPLEEVMAHLRDCSVAIEEGPVMKTGATGPIRSVYFRDPDGNLVEVSNRV